MNQYDFVDSCIIKYRWEIIPYGQVWEEAHYPVPLCLGGTETIRLWACDHTLQGLLQSEEFDHPCLHGFAERKDRENLQKFYSDYEHLLDKWLRQLRLRALQTLTPEQRSERNKKANLNRDFPSKQSLGKRLGATGLGGKAHAEKTRKVVIGISPSGQRFTFKSMREAEDATGVSRCLIRKCCNGAQKSSKGWNWKWDSNPLEDPTPENRTLL